MKTCCVLVNDLPENIVKVTSCFKINFNFIEESKIKWIERKDAETDLENKVLKITETPETGKSYKTYNIENKTFTFDWGSFFGSQSPVNYYNGLAQTIYGDGSQTRSFCYVSDLIEGMIKMMNNEENFIGPVNLGNPSERSILEFAKLIIEMTNSKSKIIYKPLPSDDPIQRKPDISLAKEKLNWEPSVDIKEGISKTIEYFDNKLQELK